MGRIAGGDTHNDRMRRSNSSGKQDRLELSEEVILCSVGVGVGEVELNRWAANISEPGSCLKESICLPGGIP